MDSQADKPLEAEEEPDHARKADQQPPAMAQEEQSAKNPPEGIDGIGNALDFAAEVGEGIY